MDDSVWRCNYMAELEKGKKKLGKMVYTQSLMAKFSI